MKLTLELTKRQIGIILYSYEQYFSILYSLLTEKIITFNNIFEDYNPALVPVCLSDFCDKDNYGYCYLHQTQIVGDTDCFIATIRQAESVLDGYLKTMYEHSTSAYRKYFLNMIIQDKLPEYFIQEAIHADLHVPVEEYIEEEGIFLELDQIVNTVQMLQLYASVYLIKLGLAHDLKQLLLPRLHSSRLSRKLSSIIDEILNNKVATGDKIITKNLDTGEVEIFLLVGTKTDGAGKTADRIEYVTKASPFGKAILGKSLHDVIEVIGPEGKKDVYKILDIEKEKVYENKVILKITDDYETEYLGDFDYTIDSKFEMASSVETGLQADFSGRQTETRLRRTGYSIWDGNRRRTDEERWHILITSSIPQLGIDEVMDTIAFHIRERQENPRYEVAVLKWSYGLLKLMSLKLKHSKLDMVDYFRDEDEL